MWLSAIIGLCSQASGDRWPNVGSDLYFNAGRYERSFQVASFTVISLAGFAAAALLVPTTNRRRAIAITCGVVATLVVRTDTYREPVRAAYVALFAALILLAWLVLRVRHPRTYLLVVAAAILGAVSVEAGATLFAWADEPNRSVVRAASAVPLLGLIGLLGFVAARWSMYEIAAAGRKAGRGTPGARYELPLAPSHPQPNSQNTLAVVAFILSFFANIPAIVCGHVALSQIRRTPERGRGLAVAALVIGYLSLVITILVVVAVMRAAQTATSY